MSKDSIYLLHYHHCGQGINSPSKLQESPKQICLPKMTPPYITRDEIHVNRVDSLFFYRKDK